ncbi:MAG: ATP-binding protein [Terrisporobacter sp.]|uniref:ATP-binding protein n=1 Tax=Terrisporobacter sp. TaxID=1965305 RepID=UPI002FCACA2A
MLHLEGLRKRVIKYYFIMIIITVALFEGLFMFYIQNFYYNSAKQSLISQANYTIDIYDNAGMESTSFEDKISNIFEKENITSNTNFSVEIIDKNKNVILDKYGIKTNDKYEYDDVNKALKGSSNLVPYTYNILGTKEHIMSISVPIKVNSQIEGVVRYSLSLRNIDNTIIKLVFFFITAGVIILIIALLLSLRFAESLIRPLKNLKQFANELAQGNYNIKLKKEELHDDEIADLVRTFEHMAVEIDKSRKLKEEFISSVSHELRTPLTSIKGWSETLGYEGIGKEELDLGLGIIQDETERMISLVEDLLDFSRLSSDRIRLQIDMVDVSKLAKGVVAQLAVKANEKNITLLTEFKTSHIEDIQGDKNRLRQVLINLVQNALKFTAEGGYVVVIVSQGEEFTTLTVTDNGVGIKKENLTKVLDKFFQEDYNKSGSGLGLAISQEIVKLHGGKMIIESEKDVGTTITFTLKNKIIESI